MRICLTGSIRNADSPECPTEKEVDEYFVQYFGGARDRNGGRATRQNPSQQDSSHTSVQNEIISHV